MSSDEEQPKSEAAAPAKKRKGLSPRARLILLALAAVALIALVIWFIHYQTRGRFLEETNDAYVQADMVTVAPKISGYIEKLYVVENQMVKAGAPLLRIDPRDYRAQTSQYQAQIAIADANVENARATIREQQAAVRQAQAELGTRRADAQFAHAQVQRYTPLAASGAETREKLANLRTQAEQADQAVAAQQAAVESARRRIAALEAQVRQARAQGSAAAAQLAAANVNLGATLIRASVDGRIGNKSAEVGSFVQAGTRLMSVVPVQNLYITANFKETQLGRMRPGQPARIKVDALPGVVLNGHVASVAPGTGGEFSLLPPQNATGNFTKIVQRVPVRIALDAGDAARQVLVPGLSVTVTVDTIAAKGALERIRDQEERRRDQAPAAR
ncbi:HlyD family secretion protein [Sphingomonas morindae]|uniref:HlyD family secretion protein n=1 Tax=Sphingomonas morindae TaxID=1541170 RepID=A0ABY4XBY3_9SPHN|nr:HlyD family secretion protein [Sphingomonas morindae]USI74422.1 HlyD family secretion protein [Sphingomonas morindae]